MGKKGKQSSGTSKKAPECACDHPFTCECGNRPERPSRGHKWDPDKQEWGGKGHKQKGASGLAAQVGTGPQTTEKGKTTVAQWQQLPSSLLAAVCSKEKRPFPKYKALKTGGSFLFRVIVQDAKASKRGGDHDLILVPASAVRNEEQAKEEAALLALLQLTPSIPHERKLPEPYKTTWLNALQAKKESIQAKKETGAKKPTFKANIEAASDNENKSNAKPSTLATSSNLISANTFSSFSERRKQNEGKRKGRNAKIRKHEAFRMANRDVQVFMSAQVRKQIEILLRGDADKELMGALMSENDDTMASDEDEDTDMVMMYVTKRLIHEGFTPSQSKAGYVAVLKNQSLALKTMNSEEDEYMDKFYDESLQWLCVHLNEDQLPEGFDPRGRTLDVIVAPKSSSSTVLKPDAGTNGGDTKIINAAKLIVQEFGVSLEEGVCLCQGEEDEVESNLWNALCQANGIDIARFDNLEGLDAEEIASNKEIAAEETEVLKAIFPEEGDLQIVSFADKHNENVIQLKIPLQSDDEENRMVCIQYYENAYPIKPPKVLIRGGWSNTNQGLGTALQSSLMKFVSELPTGEPMIFDIFNYAQEVLQDGENGVPSGSIKFGPDSMLLAHLSGGDRYARKVMRTADEKKKNPQNKRQQKKRKDYGSSFKPRPRTKSFFWSKKATETPPAIAFPKNRQDIKKARERLPAAKAREEFLEVMREADRRDRVVLITGETGCGKTTQIPQYILEDAPKDAKIIVAQPRRLAATGVADRVADERGESQPGIGSVGYVVRGDSKISNDCRLMFCTTGVLLRQLQSEGALECITHIVIDEVHERHLDTDILLGILKETRPPHLRVVLMSATMDADRFAAYWGENTPRMHIPGFTHPVKDFLLDDVLEMTGYVPPKNGKKKKKGNWSNNSNRKKSAWNDSEISDEDEEEKNPAKPSSSEGTQGIGGSNIPIEDLVKRVDSSDIDYDMLSVLVRHLVRTKDSNDDGSILVFLPGAPEINKAKDAIFKISRGERIAILPLHGGLQPREQKRVFDPSDYGTTKVILSTNVAETSITIPDCTIVIDTAREKQSSYDPSNRMPLLVEKFACRDSLKQRRGRAGRVRPGSCYKLISRETFSKLPEHGEPEIKRCALDQTLLSLVFLGVEQGSGNFLSKLIDPPSQAAVDSAIFSLVKIGALIASIEERKVTLTPLGLHLAGIPAPPCIGKLLVMGALLGCRSAALAVAAGLSGKSPFLRIDRRSIDNDTKEGYKNKLILDERDKLFDTVGNSDHAMLAAIYTGWDSIYGGDGLKRRYLDSLGLSTFAMRDMKQLAKQLDSALANAGFRSTHDSDINGKSWRIIRSCIVSALAPAQIARIQRATTKYAETSEGAVEKDGEARELKFYARSSEDNSSKTVVKYYHEVPEERVFVHPSSANFSVGTYSCPWLVYYQLVRTSMPFMRDVTECSNYDLLLFGGSLEVLASEGLIIVDKYVRMSANARIGALIGALRRKVDDLLSKKISEPSYDVAKSVEMKLIVKLLRTDGMGQ